MHERACFAVGLLLLAVAACGGESVDVADGAGTTTTTTQPLTVPEQPPTDVDRFAEDVVPVVNRMNEAWTGNHQTFLETVFTPEGGQREDVTQADGYRAEAQLFASNLQAFGEAGDALPGATDGAAVVTEYGDFWAAHDSLTGWFGQLSEEESQQADAYAADPERYSAEIIEPLNAALDRYMSACFSLQQALAGHYDVLLACGG